MKHTQNSRKKKKSYSKQVDPGVKNFLCAYSKKNLFWTQCTYIMYPTRGGDCKDSKEAQVIL